VRTVCFRTDRIGDMVLTMPAMAKLASVSAGGRVTVVASPRTRELLDGQPWVEGVIEAGLTAKGMAGILRNGKFGRAVFFFPRPGLAFAAFRAGIRERVGTAYRWYSFLFNRRARVHRRANLRHEAEYNMDILAPLGIVPDYAAPLIPPAVSPADENRAVLALAGTGLKTGWVAVHPGSLGSAQNASPEWFGRLAAELEFAGLPVLFTGTTGERNVVERAANAGGVPMERFVSPANLKVLAAVLKKASGFIGPSTGPLHVAASVGIPVVGIYPRVHSQSPVRWGPRGPKSAFVRAPDAGMDALDPREVVKALQVVMRKKK
jgi:ADP-heptose:LPS heptosyltransferase